MNYRNFGGTNQLREFDFNLLYSIERKQNSNEKLTEVNVSQVAVHYKFPEIYENYLIQRHCTTIYLHYITLLQILFQNTFKRKMQPNLGAPLHWDCNHGSFSIRSLVHVTKAYL